MWAPSFPPDVRLHQRWHNEWEHGVRLAPLGGDCVVSTQGDLEILVVSPKAVFSQRHRAYRVARLANRETRYDFGVYPFPIYGPHQSTDSPVYAFLARKQKRATGIAILWHREILGNAPWGDNDEPDYARLTKYHERTGWAVNFVWTHRQHRRQGIAAFLVRIAAMHLGIPVENLGWLQPFEPAGAKLSRHLCPDVLNVA